MLYINEWIERSITDPQTLSLFYPIDIVRSIDRPNEFDALRVNWTYIGIDPENASVTLYREQGEPPESTNPTKIRSVGISEGRNTILFTVTDLDGLPKKVAPENGSRFRRVSNGVYIHCD